MRFHQAAWTRRQEPDDRVAQAGRRSASWGASLALVALGLTACGSVGAPHSGPSPSRRLTQADHANAELQQVSACLQKAGWRVKLDPGQGYSAEVPEAQRAAYSEDRAKCEKEFLGKYPRPEMTEADWRKLYKHQLWLVKCLDGEGYPPVSTPPSAADYVADGLSGIAPSWYAWEAVGGAPPVELEAKCPQAPPGMWLNRRRPCLHATR